MSSAKNELTFMRCPSCRSLVPTGSVKCRMCGFAFEGQEGDVSAGRSSGRVRQRTVSKSRAEILDALQHAEKGIQGMHDEPPAQIEHKLNDSDSTLENKNQDDQQWQQQQAEEEPIQELPEHEPPAEEELPEQEPFAQNDNEQDSQLEATPEKEEVVIFEEEGDSLAEEQTVENTTAPEKDEPVVELAVVEPIVEDVSVSQKDEPVAKPVEESSDSTHVPQETLNASETTQEELNTLPAEEDVKTEEPLPKELAVPEESKPASEPASEVQPVVESFSEKDQQAKKHLDVMSIPKSPDSGGFRLRGSSAPTADSGIERKPEKGSPIVTDRERSSGALSHAKPNEGRSERAKQEYKVQDKKEETTDPRHRPERLRDRNSNQDSRLEQNRSDRGRGRDDVHGDGNRENRGRNDRHAQMLSRELPTKESQRPRAERVSTIEVGMLHGWLVNYEDKLGVAVELRDSKFFVSRERIRSTDLVVDDPSLSSPHCLVTMLQDGSMQVQDLLSEFGIFVKKYGDKEFNKILDMGTVTNGDTIRFGTVEYLLVLIPG
jgi:hypothetical protein